MDCTIGELAKMARVSTRTLRHYDACGLLPAHRDASNGYRLYGRSEIDRLQQIMFFRELGFSLKDTAIAMSAPDYEPLAALESHLAVLKSRRVQLDALIRNVENTMRAMKGESAMSDHDKFEGFKQSLIDENERRYGAEVRARYGDETIERANNKLRGMSEAQYAESQRLTDALNEALKAAFAQGDPEGPLAQEVCRLHKEWLCFWWGDGAYSKEAHLAMGQMYVDDARFSAYYDKMAPGLAVFLRDALRAFCR